MIYYLVIDSWYVIIYLLMPISIGGITLKKILSNYDNLINLLFFLTICLITTFDFSWINLIINIFLLISLLIPLKSTNWVLVSLWLIFKPLLVSFFILVFVGACINFLNIDGEMYTGVFLIFLFLFLIPTVSCFLLIHNWKNNVFRDTVKVALEANNTLALIVVSATLIFLSMTGDFGPHLLTSLIESLNSAKFSSDFLADLLNFLAFPFLVSNALLKCVVEYLLWKEKYHEKT